MPVNKIHTPKSKHFTLSMLKKKVQILKIIASIQSFDFKKCVETFLKIDISIVQLKIHSTNA